jgi:hypothetical protein
MGDVLPNVRRSLSCKLVLAVHYARYTRNTVVGEFQTYLRLRAAKDVQAEFVRTSGQSATVDLIRSLESDQNAQLRDVAIQSYKSSDSDDDEASVVFTTEAADASKASESASASATHSTTYFIPPTMTTLGASGSPHGYDDSTAIDDGKVGTPPHGSGFMTQRSEAMDMTLISRSPRLDSAGEEKADSLLFKLDRVE